MAFEYNAEQHKSLGDEEYKKWLRSWNQDPAEVIPGEDKTTTESQASDAPAGDEPDDDYDEWTAEELRKELAKRELSQSGNKAELIARLREDDADDES